MAKRGGWDDAPTVTLAVNEDTHVRRLDSDGPVSCVLGCSATQHDSPQYQIVLPGCDALDPERITPHRVQYERPGAFMGYDLHTVDRYGREVYELFVFFNQTTGEPDKMYVDPVSLGHLGRRLTTPSYVVDVRLTDGHVTGELVPSENSEQEPVAPDKTYSHGGFEPAIINYFIAALPLAEGYTASLPIFDVSRGSGMYWANIAVVGREYDTWKVESRGMRKKTIWISPTEPYAIKMITEGSFRLCVVVP